MRNKTRKLTRRRYRGGHDNKTMFPLKRGVDYDLLKISHVGKYSLTWREDSTIFIRRMKEIVGDLSDKHITDLNGGVGGDTIMFALHYKKVDSIERDTGTFEILKHNVGVYGLDNVTLHHGDSTTVYNWKSDVLFIDPPWGGPSYKEHTNLDLLLGDYRLDDYVAYVLEQSWRPKYVFLKLPFNYNFDRLKRFKHVKIFKVHRIMLVAIKTD